MTVIPESDRVAGPTLRLARLLRRRTDVVAAVAFFCVLATRVPYLLAYVTKQVPYDLYIYRETAGGVFAGTPLYDRIPADFDGLLEPIVTGFTYPPAAAVVLAPLALGPIEAVALVLMLASMAAAVRVCVLLGRAASRVPGARISPRTATWVMLTAAALMAPVDSVLRMGQIGLLLLWLVVEDLLGAVPDHRRGYLVGLASGLKLVPAFVAVALLVAGRRAEAGRAAVAFGATVVVGFMVDPESSWRYWSHLGSPTSVGDMAWSQNQTPAGFLMRVLGDHTGWLVYLPIAVALSVAVLLVVRRLERAGQELGVAAGSLLGMLLVSPLSWEHYFVCLLPLVALLVAHASSHRIALAVLVPAMAVLAARPFWTMVPFADGREHDWNGTQIVVGNAYLIVALVLLGWLAWYASSTRPDGQRPRDSAMRSTQRSTA